MDPSGANIRFAYYGANNRNLKFATCSDYTCTSKAISTVATGSVGSYASMALKSYQGKIIPYISYYNDAETYSNLRVSYGTELINVSLTINEGALYTNNNLAALVPSAETSYQMIFSEDPDFTDAN